MVKGAAETGGGMMAEVVEQKYGCPKCERWFVTAEEYVDHYAEEHDPNIRLRGPFPSTPHEEERAEAAAEVAEAHADAAEESAEEAIETAAEVEEVVGELEEAIPEDTSPEVKAGMMEALEVIADLAESEAEEAIGAAAGAEVAAELAESAAEAGDVAEAQAEAETTGNLAELAEESAADVAPRRRGFARAWWGE